MSSSPNHATCNIRKENHTHYYDQRMLDDSLIVMKINRCSSDIFDLFVYLSGVIRILLASKSKIREVKIPYNYNKVIIKIH